MISSGKTLMFALFAALPAAAQEPSSVVPEALTLRVAEQIGQLWNLPARDVHLDWGHLSSPRALDGQTPFRLLGGGEDGWFAVVFEPEGRSQVASRLRAGCTDSVLIATRPLIAGTRLAAGDLRLQARIHWGAPSRGEEPQPTIGWVARRGIREGSVIDRSLAGPPPLVDSGKQVRVIWRGGSVSVAVEGVALNSAGLGELVRVRTTGRLGMVRGTVSGPGEATMDN
jgi:flagella basal body P-ring formation protein FlgA